MPMFTLHRHYLLRTTKGHTIKFLKGKPTFVPPLCVEDAVAIGAVPENEADGDVLGEEVVEVVLSPAERKTKIRAAIEVMVRRNERNDFTGNGMPHLKKLEALTGFDVHSREREKIWQEFREEQMAADEEAKLDAELAAATDSVEVS